MLRVFLSLSLLWLATIASAASRADFRLRDSDLPRLLNDSTSLFWDCKPLVVSTQLERSSKSALPDWKLLKATSKNQFDNRARLEVQPTQVLELRNAIPLTEAVLKRYRTALLPILPKSERQSANAVRQLEGLRIVLSELGYNQTKLSYLAGYRHSQIGFLGYVLLGDYPLFQPCFKTPFAAPPIKVGAETGPPRVIKADSLTYLGFLSNNQPARLVKVLGDGTRVEDAFSGQRFRVLDAVGRSMRLDRAPLKVQIAAAQPLVLELRLKAE